MMCAMLTYLAPEYADLFRIGFVASFATKLSDTFGSEIGKAFGRTTYLITTLKLVPRGTEGAVSLEGTVAGIAASAVLTGLATALGVISGAESFSICIFSALIATTIESFIGAIFQDNVPWLTNEFVNFIMTVISAAIGISTAAVLQTI